MSGEVFVNGQFIGHAVKEVQVATVDPDPKPIAIAPPEVSIKLQATSIDKDAIDALFMNLPPIAESAAIATREFAGKLRNIVFHADPTRGQVEHMTVTGDLDDLVFFDAAKNRRFRRWKRNRMLRNCRERARAWGSNRAFLECNRLMREKLAQGLEWSMNDVNRVRKMMGMRQLSAAEWRADL